MFKQSLTEPYRPLYQREWGTNKMEMWIISLNVLSASVSLESGTFSYQTRRTNMCVVEISISVVLAHLYLSLCSPPGQMFSSPPDPHQAD